MSGKGRLGLHSSSATVEEKLAALFDELRDALPPEERDAAMKKALEVQPLPDRIMCSLKVDIPTEVPRDAFVPRGKPPKSPKVGWEEAAPLIGQAADFASTVVALRAGAQEQNPLLKGIVKSTPLFAAVKAAVGVGLGAGVYLLEKNGHPKAAKIAGVVAAVMGLGPAAHNIGVLGKIRRQGG